MMQSTLGHLFGEFGHILGICPCCGELFRLTDARPYLKRKPMRSPLDDIEEEEGRLARAGERLDDREAEHRERAAILGQRRAKRRLRNIDQTFSGSGLDPQDVKVIFDPVEYIVFDGMSNGSVKRVVFMAHPPTNRYEEGVTASLDRTVKRGNYEFKTLRVTDDGKITLK
jgi:predicted Holliday junction resolvase-like endonuclease